MTKGAVEFHIGEAPAGGNTEDALHPIAQTEIYSVIEATRNWELVCDVIF